MLEGRGEAEPPEAKAHVAVTEAQAGAATNCPFSWVATATKSNRWSCRQYMGSGEGTIDVDDDGDAFRLVCAG